MVSTYVIHVNYTDHYSFTDPGGMEGWDGLVGWPTADALPTKWSHVNHGSGVDHGMSASTTKVLLGVTHRLVEPFLSIRTKHATFRRPSADKSMYITINGENTLWLLEKILHVQSRRRLKNFFSLAGTSVRQQQTINCTQSLLHCTQPHEKNTPRDRRIYRRR